ncbi:MAG: cellulase family glycosylhydrolase [Mariniphaga sp.]
MKVLLILLSIICMTILPAVSQDFKVKGTKIIEPQGKEFLPKGINVNGPHWPWKRNTIDDAHLITDVWKFNSVRVNIFPRLKNIFQTNTDLDGIVEAYTSRKVVTILEVHDYTGTYPDLKEGNPSLEEFKDWWVDKAQRYKNNPYVWFNLMNEPGGNEPVPALWKDHHEYVIKAIRATGAKNIIVLDGHHFGQEGGYKDPAWSGILTYGEYFRKNYDNIVFSLHIYSLWKDGEERLERYASELKKKKLAFFFGEYGESDRHNENATAAMFRVALRHNLGRMAWQWSSEKNAGNDLTYKTSVGAGWEIDKKDGSKPSNLTWMGSIIWDDNHGKLTPDKVKLEGPPVKNGNFEDRLYGWQNYGGARIVTGADSVRSGDYAMLVPPGKKGGGTSQLLYLEPNTTYVLSAWGKYTGEPAKPAVLSIRYKLSDGKNAEHTIRFDKDEFTHQQTKFTTPAAFTGAEMFINKPDANKILIVDDIEIKDKVLHQ